MPSRVTAFLLAVVLFWSALSTLEAPSAWAEHAPGQHRVLVEAGGPADLRDGSVEDHHLDDLPLQAQSDLPAETPGMLPPSLAPSSVVLSIAQRHRFVPVAAGSPFLAGPLRPPCSGHRAA